MASSRFTSASYPFENSAAELFHDRRQFISGVLQSWGIQICDLTYSTDNVKILNCLMGLVEMRQKDITNRNRAKDQLSAVTFDRDKYRSCLQIAKREIEQKNKVLGRVENESLEIKNKMKKVEAASRKQQEESKKAFVMLKSKNQQILHEMKKKEQEVAKIKEQLKKSVGEKLEKGVVKNSFQVIQGLVLEKGNCSPTKKEEEKYNFLIARSDAQLKAVRQQNLLMKQKLHQIRDLIVDLSVWIDRNLFGEEVSQQILMQKYRNKMPINHYLLFKKQSIVDEMSQMIEGVKDGILQIRSFKQKNGLKKMEERNSVRTEQSGFKKKGFSMREQFQTSQKMNRKISNQVQNASKNAGNTPPPLNRNQSNPASGIKLRQSLQPQIYTSSTSSRPSLESLQPIHPPEDILLDDGESETSIISHISMDQIKKQKSYDKWDVLFRD